MTDLKSLGTRFSSTDGRIGTAKGPYSAIVYIDDSRVVAEDADGKVIASGVAGTDDTTVRDAALSFANGKKLLIACNMIWNTPLSGIAEYTEIEQLPGYRITLGADINAIQILATSSSKEYIKLSSLTFIPLLAHTSSIIYIEASNGFAVTWCEFSDITIEGVDTYTPTVMGIEIRAQTAGGIAFNSFNNVRLKYVNLGIKFSTTTEGYIGGNRFNNLYVWQFVTGIEWFNSGTGNGAFHNQFSSTGLQAATWSKDGFKNVEGRNSLIDCACWDWDSVVAPNYAISIAPAAHCVTIIESDYENILDRSTVNDLGLNTLWIMPQQTNYGYKNVVVVSDDPNDLNADYTSLSAALAAITGTPANRYLVLVYGSIAETSYLTAKSYVDVRGPAVITVTSTKGLYVPSTVHDAKWQDIHIIGEGATCDYALVTDPNTNYNQIEFEGCVFESTASKAVSNLGAFIYSNAMFRNCKFIGGPSGNSSHAAFLSEGYAKFYNCEFIAQSSGTSSHGVCAYDGCVMELVGCSSTGGIGAGSDAYMMSSVSMPIFDGCVSQTRSNGKHYEIVSCSSPEIYNCRTKLSTYNGLWFYANADNGRFRPFDTPAYTLIDILVIVYVANPATTLDIGTSIGGHQICQNVDISTTGSKYVAFSRASVAAGEYLYTTPSGAIADRDVLIFYIVSYDYMSIPLYLGTYGYAKIFNSTFLADGAAARCVQIHTQAKNYLVEKCSFDVLNPVTNSIEATAGAITGERFKECTVSSAVVGITGLNNKSSGSSTGTGAEQTIAHGLIAAPSKVVIVPTVTDGLVVKVWADTANIYPTVTSGKAFNWSAEV